MRSDNELHDFKHLQIGTVEHMMGVLGRNPGWGWFYSCLVSGAGWGERSTVV